MINEERIKNTFCDLVRIYAPSKGERDVAEYLKKALKRLGGRVYEDGTGEKTGGNCGNLIAVFPANAEGMPSVAFTGHMDCVEVCKGIEPVLEDGVFRSKGDTILGGDDKAGVAAILEALAVMKETMIPHGKVTAIFTVQEESSLNGSRYIDPKYTEGIDFGYVLDADGEAGTAINEGPGEYKVTCTMHGRAAHAGIEPEKGINAIKMAAAAIAKIESGRIDEETTCNVGVIEGGRATNIVPELCTVRAEARSRDEAKLHAVVDKMAAAFQSVEADFPGGQAEVTVEELYKGFKLGEDHDAVRLFRQACGARKFKVRLGATGGGSDANWFNKQAFPALLMGVGMTDFHTSKESLKEKDLYEAAELVYAIIEEEAHFSQHK